MCISCIGSIYLKRCHTRRYDALREEALEALEEVRGTERSDDLIDLNDY
jgi:hypothetical protein